MTTKTKLKRLIKDPTARKIIIGAGISVATAIGLKVSPEFADAISAILAVMGTVL